MPAPGPAGGLLVATHFVYSMVKIYLPRAPLSSSASPLTPAPRRICYAMLCYAMLCTSAQALKRKRTFRAFGWDAAGSRNRTGADSAPGTYRTRERASRALGAPLPQSVAPSRALVRRRQLLAPLAKGDALRAHVLLAAQEDALGALRDALRRRARVRVLRRRARTRQPTPAMRTPSANAARRRASGRDRLIRPPRPQASARSRRWSAVAARGSKRRRGGARARGSAWRASSRGAATTSSSGIGRVWRQLAAASQPARAKTAVA